MLVPESPFALCGTKSDISPVNPVLQGLEMTSMEASKLIEALEGVRANVEEIKTDVAKLSTNNDHVMPKLESVSSRLVKVELEIAEMRGQSKGKTGLVAMAAAIAGLIATAAQFIK